MKFYSILIITLLHLGLNAQETGQYTEEEIAFQQAFIAARQHMLIEDYPQALEAFENLYKQGRNNAAICFELARLNAIQSREDEAVKFAENAIKLSPENEWYQIFYANLMMESGSFKKAIGSFEYLNNHFPDNPDYYDQLAYAYLADKQYDKAIFVLTNQETRLGISDEIIMKKFEVYDKSGESELAVQQLQRIISRNPENTDLLNKLATYYTEIGQSDQAKEIYAQILTIDPNDTRANVAVLGNPDDPEDESVYLRTLIPLIQNSQIPLDAKLKEIIPYVEKLAANYDPGAAKALDEVTRNLILVHSEDAKAYAIRGDVMLLSKNVKGAIDIYQMTLERNDRVFSVWEQLMYALYWQNEYDQLLKTSMDAVDLFPNQAISYIFNAYANAFSANYEKGVDILQEAELISGRNIFFRSEIASASGRLEFESGNIASAENAGQQALKLSENNNPNALELMGDIHYKKGEKNKALDFWKQAVQRGNLSEALQLKIEQNQIIE